jgi:microsomal dipeptidase-like Zn-dependent dipeptidase
MKIFAWIYISLILIVKESQAQITPDTSRYKSYTDFHIHSSFKNYYRNVETPDSTILYADDPAYLNNKYGRSNWVPFTKNEKDKIKGKESNMINYDQADYGNLKGLGGSVLCMSITPPEKIMLSSSADRWLNQHLVMHMPVKRQEVLAAENNSSFHEFLGEYYYVISQDSVRDGTKILLAKNNADLRRIVGEGGIGLVMTMEGGHVLFGNNVLNKMKNLKSGSCDMDCQLEILGNIDKIRALPHRVFFITVAHFGWNKMFGNAKSLDKAGFRRRLLTTASFSENFNKSTLAKYGDGIMGDVQSLDLTDTVYASNGHKMHIRLPYSKDSYKTDIGYQVMYKLLDAAHNYANPIYLDTKHMSIKTRFQYYAYVDSVNKEKRLRGEKTIPIIASHIGLSGKKRPVAVATAMNPLNDSYEELIFGPTFYQIQLNDNDLFWRTYTHLLKTDDRELFFGPGSRNNPNGFNPFEGLVNYNTLGWFYPWGINFCDEEIRFIYESDGIIGLTMDSRILGFEMPNYTHFYKKFLRNKFVDIYGKEKFSLPDGTEISFDDYYHSEPLIRNILHIIEECGRKDVSAWDHVAIGSDYDGFIQPLKPSSTAESIPVFHKKMVRFLETFVEIHNQQPLLYGLSTEEAMNKFFFTNGRDFIFKYFQN